MKRFALICICSALILGCRTAAPLRPTSVDGFLEGVGPHRRTVTTTSAEAQTYFDQGLALLYAFNHDEAIRSFTRAAAIDPSCAMAAWGIAYANGPHINNTGVPDDRAKRAWKAIEQASARAGSGTPVERDLIEALGARYAWPQPEDRAPLDVAYATAMRVVWQAHPDDADVAALYGEALMDLHPWDLWNHDGSAQPWTGEIVTHLERTLELAADHPLALHLYIHAVEASPNPEKADSAADRLRDLMPGLGHMVHMPSHVDVLRGRWEEAIVANTKAIEADRRYRARVPEQDFYHLYMAHNQHMRAFAAMMTGRSELALSSVREMIAVFPEKWTRENAHFADGWFAMPFEVLMRFGRWQEILDEPEPADYLPLSRALRFYARGVAHAALGQVEQARAEQARFAAAGTLVGDDAVFGNNPARALLGVAEALLDGEIRYRAGDREGGFAALREAVRREDDLRYDEPPDWIQPVRHALGAALLQADRPAEAETVFREALVRWPGDGWALFGLGRALRGQGKDAEAAAEEARFAEAWKSADVSIDSPCFCQPGV